LKSKRKIEQADQLVSGLYQTDGVVCIFFTA